MRNHSWLCAAVMLLMPLLLLSGCAHEGGMSSDRPYDFVRDEMATPLPWAVPVDPVFIDYAY